MNSIYSYFDRMGAFKKPTNAGFAIRSPSAPGAGSRSLDHRATSDQVRASWVIAWKLYLNHYIWLFVEFGRKVVAK